MNSFKKWMPLAAGIIVTAVGIALDVYTYIQGDYKNTNYAYALLVTFVGALILFTAISGLFKAKRAGTGAKSPSGADITTLAQAALCAALCYIGFAFFKIDIPVGTEKTAFHFGNVFCVIAALLIGGYWGGLAGAVGMTIGDLTTAYVTSAPKTFVLKLCIGLIVGVVAHKAFKLSKPHSAKYTAVATIVSAAAGMAFNIVADPLVGYFYKMYLYGIPQDMSKTLAKISTVTTSVNAVIAVAAASVIYLALRPVMKKAGLLKELS